MNTFAIAPHVVKQPVPHATAGRVAPDAAPRSSAQRLPVWEERARKMGFPPSAR